MFNRDAQPRTETKFRKIIHLEDATNIQMKMNATVKQGLSIESRYESKWKILNLRTVLGQKWRGSGSRSGGPWITMWRVNFNFEQRNKKFHF